MINQDGNNNTKQLQLFQAKQIDDLNKTFPHHEGESPFDALFSALDEPLSQSSTDEELTHELIQKKTSENEAPAGEEAAPLKERQNPMPSDVKNEKQSPEKPLSKMKGKEGDMPQNEQQKIDAKELKAKDAEHDQKKQAEIMGEKIKDDSTQDEIQITGSYFPAYANSIVQPETSHVTHQEPAETTEQLIERIYRLAASLINKAEVFVDVDNQEFTIQVTESFLQDTHITLLAKGEVMVITFKPATADQYQFLQKEQQTLKKKIKENNSDANIQFVIEEP